MPYDADFYLVVDEEAVHSVDEAVRDLAMIGLDRIAGYFPATVVRDRSARGEALATIPQITPGELAARLQAGAARRSP